MIDYSQITMILIINSLVCFGFWNACLYEVDKKGNETKGVLWFLEKWSKGKWFYKPLCGCLPCMASLHGAYVYVAFLYVTNNICLNSLIIYPIYTIALSGLNYLIYSFID